MYMFSGHNWSAVAVYTEQKQIIEFYIWCTRKRNVPVMLSYH